MHSRQKSVISLVVGAGFSFGLLVTAVQAQSGTLEPPGSAVDGVGDPVPTTQTQPSWDQGLPAAERFVRVLPTAATSAGEGVLDKNTGLVWEQSPLTTTHTWANARFQCTSRTVGDRKGWRLPSVHELASPVVPGNPAGGPDLPAGHPFSNVQSFRYWSATTSADLPTNAWHVSFGSGFVFTNLKTLNSFVWCVRSGGPLSEY